jgi:hypothetical protein
MNPIEKKRKYNNFLEHINKRYASLSRKQKIFVKKIIVDKVHKLVVMKLKLDVDCHIQTSRNHNLLQV